MNKQPRLFRQAQSRVVASTPGTLIPIRNAQQSVISIIAFDQEKIIEQTLDKPEDIETFIEKWPVVWINVNGLGSTDFLEKFGDIFGIHPLALESVLNVHHRPKIEEYDNHLHMIVKMATIRNDILDIEQLSFFIGKNYILTFQERDVDDVFDPVRQRLYKQERRHRFMKHDYLGYALVDALIDGYFPVLEHYTDRLAELEDIVIGKPDPSFIECIHDMKRDLQSLRHGIWPMREVLNKLSDDMPFISDDTRIYLRSCYDHTIQIIDILETFRERASSLSDIYLSSISNKMNEVMKVLTIIATIFMPLSFITGLYGMNFDSAISPFNMPELSWYFGYPFALSIMAIQVSGLLWFFKKKGWLGGD